MVNLGNTLFAKSHAMRLAKIEQERAERERGMKVLAETAARMEDAKDRDFDRQMRMAEMEGKFSQLAGAPAPVSRNERIAQALRLGGMGARAEEAQTASERDFRTGEREASQMFQRGQQESGQDFRSGEREAAQRFQAGEAVLDRQLRRDLAAQQLGIKGAGSLAASMEARKALDMSKKPLYGFLDRAMQGTGMQMKVDKKTGGIQLFGQVASPQARELAEKVKVINQILPGVRDPRVADELGQIVASGAPPLDIQKWWHMQMTGIPPDLDPNFRSWTTSTGPTTTPQAGGSVGGKEALNERARRLNDLRQQREGTRPRP